MSAQRYRRIAIEKGLFAREHVWGRGERENMNVHA